MFMIKMIVTMTTGDRKQVFHQVECIQVKYFSFFKETKHLRTGSWNVFILWVP